MKKRLLVFFVLLLVLTLSIGLLTACGEKLKENGSKVDIKDVEYELDEDGNIIGTKYPAKEITVDYLLANNSIVTLKGEKPSEMMIVDYEGDIEAINLADIEKNVKVEKEGINVIGIDDYAFNGAATLKTVDLTKARQALRFSIGDYAFADCTSLESVILPADSYSSENRIGAAAFKNDVKLTSVVNFDKFNRLDSRIFYNCSALESVVMPNVDYIPDSMFLGCKALKSFAFGSNLLAIENYAFANTSLESVDFTTSPKLEYIGEGAFRENNISTLFVPDSVIYIGNKSFSANPLTSVDIPFLGNEFGSNGSITVSLAPYPYIEEKFIDTYNNKTFDNVDGLPVTVNVRRATGIPEGYFIESNVKEVNINFLDRGEYDIISNSVPQKVKIEPVLEIYDNTFADAKLLEKLTINKQVEYIGDQAFANTPKLSDLSSVLGEGLTYIGVEAFKGSGIKNAVFPSTLKDLGVNVFYNAGDLESIEFLKVSNNEDNVNYPINILDSYNSFVDYFGADVPEVVDLKNGKPVFVDGTKFYDVEDNNVDYLNSDTFVPLSLKKIVLSDVTFIPDDFLNGFKNVEEVVVNNYIPNGIRDIYIGRNAFSKTGITDASTILLEGVVAVLERAFAYTNIKDIAFPESIEVVQKEALYNVPLLESLTFKSFQRAIFEDGELVDTIDVTMGNPIYVLFGADANNSSKKDGNPFYAVTTNPKVIFAPKTLKTLNLNNVLYLNDNLCNGMNSLENISVVRGDMTGLESEGLTGLVIGQYAFRNTSITNANDIISQSIAILDEAFVGTKLTNVTIGESIEYLDGNAFNNIDTLTEVNIKVNDVGAISNNLFYGCNNIKKYTTNAQKQINLLIDSKMLEEVVITDGITTLDANFFAGQEKLKNVTLPDLLSKIEAGAFSDCTNLAKDANGYLVVDGWLISTPNLSSIVVPSGVVGFANNYDVHANTIYFKGTEADYAALKGYKTSDTVVFYDDSQMAYVDDILYKYTSVPGPDSTVVENVEVVLIGDESKQSRAAEIKDNVTIGGVERQVTIIPDNVVISNNVTKLVIPATVTSITQQITSFSSIDTFVYKVSQAKLDEFKSNNPNVFPDSTSYLVEAGEALKTYTYNLYVGDKLVDTKVGLYYDRPYNFYDANTIIYGYYLDDVFSSSKKITLPYRATGEDTTVNIYLKYRTFDFTFDDVTSDKVQYKFVKNGGTYVSSNAYIDSSSSVIELKANDDMRVQFKYSADSEYGYDELFIYVNGVLKKTESGSFTNYTLTLDLDKGDVVKFEYTKDGSGNIGTDCVKFTIDSFAPIGG